MSQPIHNAEDLDRLATAGRATLYPDDLKILVGSASCGIAMGAREVEAAAIESVEKLGLAATVSRTGCIGFCAHEPLLDLILPDGPRVCYGKMTPEKTRELLAAYAPDGSLRPEWALARFAAEEHLSIDEKHKYPRADACFFAGGLGAIPEWNELDFNRRQQKIILRNCGSVDPRDLEQTIARGSYRGALQALTKMTPDEVIEEVTKSGLRGRGGAAFPTGKKWQFARAAAGETKYVICNADEGAPGAYMDRTVLEGDPHAIIEGMIIGSYAIGASEGYLYVRSEYPLAIELLGHAIEEAEKVGLLGDDVLGTGWSFKLRIRRGAGAYICGEETALIESIEGHSGEPRNRPPYPVVEGLYGKPTVVNNVKTWASVPPIITRGSAWYAAIGAEGSSGTTVFSLEGAVKNRGLVEVPFGVTLHEMIYDIGGGMESDRPLKAVQAGGPSRGCIPPSMLESKDAAAAAEVMGIGGIIVLDDRACMVDMARFLVGFFVDESCGKCTPCREGTRQIYNILTRICEGRGSLDHLDLLERLARGVMAASVCGLGSMAPNPVLVALEHFRDEFEAHINEKKCPAGVCQFELGRQLNCHPNEEELARG